MARHSGPARSLRWSFNCPADAALLTMPEQALIFRAPGPQVALVDAQNRVHLQDVTLGKNLGQIVQVVSGLAEDDRFVNNPPAGLLEGQLVQPVKAVPGYAAPTENRTFAGAICTSDRPESTRETQMTLPSLPGGLPR